MKNHLFLFLVLFSAMNFGQNSLFFQQKALLNPAMANVENKTNISFSTVIAYNNFYTGRLNTEYQVKDHHNLSFNGLYEQLNGYNLFNLKFGYAYAFKFSDAFNMNIGADVGMGFLGVSGSNTSGPYGQTEVNFNGDFGVSFYGQSYYVGLNAQYISKFNVLFVNYPTGLYLNLMAGFNRPVSEKIRFSLDGVVNTGFSKTNAGLSARFNFYGYFWVGIGYRYYQELYERSTSSTSLVRNDIVIPIGLQAKNFTLSYAFNFDVGSAVSTVTSSYHEIIFGWRIPHPNREDDGPQYVE